LGSTCQRIRRINSTPGVPLELYLAHGFIKVAIALGRGKKLYDKRETLKRRTAEREVERAVRAAR
jgi:SsrA-binding protein